MCAQAATQSVGGGKAGVAERDAKANIKGAECQEPGCAGVKLASLTVCKTHWSNKHCTCRRAECECFPAEKYELMFARPTEKVHTHHNQLATNSSNKNASKAVRGSGRWRQSAGLPWPRVPTSPPAGSCRRYTPRIAVSVTSELVEASPARWKSWQKAAGSPPPLLHPPQAR